MFTSAQSLAHVFARKGANGAAKGVKQLTFRAIAAGAAINSAGQIVAQHYVEKAYKADDFLEFLAKLTKHTKGKPCVLFLDNLNVHRGKRAAAYCQRHNVKLLYNAIYVSEYNPIERLWLHSKANFKRLMIGFTAYGSQARVLSIVKKAVAMVPPEKLAWAV